MKKRFSDEQIISILREAEAGFYAQDQLSHQQWRATFGVHHDWSSIRTTDLLGYNANG